MLKIALLCGGPSLERGISLNSARSVCDHLQSEDIEVLPVYFDHRRNAYKISRAQLYCNTPSDFDFKLHFSAKPMSRRAFERFLKTVDLAFPAMHGMFGEDGGIQRILERAGCPYIGSPVEACKIAFDKYESNEFIARHGFFAIPSIVLKSHLKDHKKLLTDFFTRYKLKRAIVKPATGGSSIGVHSVSTVEEALVAVRSLFSKRIDTRIVVEPFCTGTEFTVIILENRFDMPVAILPTEIEIDYSEHQIFDTRKKYLATRAVTYHCPPRFPDHIVERIQIQAEQLFKLLGMRDFARFDGWLLPDGNLWFSDFNPISGMEQNSFLFQQSSQIGMSHADLLRHVVKNACRRYHIHFPQKLFEVHKFKKRINVLFGGKTAERQVSVMSGTNAWLKLRRSVAYDPHPYLLDLEHNVWKIPYAMTLNHTVEEIMATCKSAKRDEARLHELKRRVVDKLAAEEGDLSEPWFLPEKMSLDEFVKTSSHVLIGLHGGIGEDGTLQAMLEKRKIHFNGSGSQASALCMDKYATAQALSGLEKEGIYTPRKKLVDVEVFKLFKLSLDYRRFWKALTQGLGGKTIIVKPPDDGCSSGIARLYSARDLETYLHHVRRHAPAIPQGTLHEQHGIIEMPTCPMTRVMFEQFIATDKVRVIRDRLQWKTVSEWIEITMGLVGKKGHMRAMNLSITVALGNILTLEEKFQGGTGVNITPPPQPYVKKSAVEKAKKRMEQVAQALG
ncbi:MAG: hypothetical protein V1908_02520, partial [Candidatus Peregrinibacteria bacterium]